MVWLDCGLACRLRFVAQMTDEEFKARKKENIKLNKEAQALLAFYRKELKKLSDRMRNA